MICEKCSFKKDSTNFTSSTLGVCMCDEKHTNIFKLFTFDTNKPEEV